MHAVFESLFIMHSRSTKFPLDFALNVGNRRYTVVSYLGTQKCFPMSQRLLIVLDPWSSLVPLFVFIVLSF